MKNIKLALFSCFMLLALFVAFSPLNAKTSEKTGEGKLDDVVIKDKDTFKIEKEKPPVSISVDHMKVIIPTIKTEKYFLNGQADKPETDDLDIPFSLETKESISPWLCSIISEPVINFVFETKTVNSAAWKLIITDDRGKAFYVFSGKNDVPSTIVWEGRDETGIFMLPGMVYSYIFEVTDKHGAKNTVIGKPFTLNAIEHQEVKGTIIGLSLKALFDTNKNGLEISSNGLLLLKEVSDYVKKYFDYGLIIRTYSENKELAAKQSRMISTNIADTLLMPQELISVEGYTAPPEERRSECIIWYLRQRRKWNNKDDASNKLIIKVEVPAADTKPNSTIKIP